MKTITTLFALGGFLNIVFGVALPPDNTEITPANVNAADCNEGESKCAIYYHAVSICQGGTWSVLSPCKPKYHCVATGKKTAKCVLDVQLAEDTTAHDTTDAASDVPLIIDHTSGNDSDDSVSTANITVNGQLPCQFCRQYKSDCMNKCWTRQSTCVGHCSQLCRDAHVKYDRGLGFNCNYFCPKAC